MLEDIAIRFSEPSGKYKMVMNEMIKRNQQGNLILHSWEDIKKQYGQ